MNWRKSSHSSTGGCAEVGLWRKSSHSAASECAEIGSWRKSSLSFSNGNCAEVGQGDAVIGVRDTKQEHLGDARTVLEFTPAAWAAFTARIREGSTP
jgi:hypothetical protein